ncbi:hypothetical protein [Amycolatopsis xylanica]|uniref:hypothetical protein n=1 Tax=Amycolatopsis xylanica TaxID=589385 RepID=UPI00115FE821|nr:hypothetical protein [Amycolatopsis xylanica]
MTGPVSTLLLDARRPGLPLVEVPDLARTGALQYGLGRIDAPGRVSDSSLFRALGWVRGQRLMLSVLGTAVVVQPHPAGLLEVRGGRYAV